VGRIGDDVFGEFLERELHEAGVRTHLARDLSLATGKVFVLVDGAGERTMITDRGAVEKLSPEDLPHPSFAGDTCTSSATRSRAAAAGRPPSRPCAWPASPG
jgi:sugar/nucleoside kinase (ribokinase family)